VQNDFIITFCEIRMRTLGGEMDLPSPPLMTPGTWFEVGGLGFRVNGLGLGIKVLEFGV